MSSAGAPQHDWSPGNIVKLKGLPFKATSEDVAKFFDGLPLHEHGVMFKRHPDGRPNGEAFVLFEGPGQVRSATRKDREIFGERFGERYVRVYTTLDSDLPEVHMMLSQSKTLQGQFSGQLSDSVVKVKSLPFDASQLDIIQFFESFQLKPNGVQIVIRSNNKPTGEAFVDFESSEEALRAIQEKDHNIFSDRFGSRYVRLIQVSRKEMHATLALRFGGEGILKMKGIPFKASPMDVRRFFRGYAIKPEGISFVMHADGRPTGMAFIEFATPQEAVRAIEKDRTKFGAEYGDRFCMLQLVGRYEMDKVALLREVDSDHNQLRNNANLLQQATALHASAFSNPGLLNPALAKSLLLNNPWLQLAAAASRGLMNPAAAYPGMQLGRPHTQLNTSQPLIEAMLSQQLSQQLQLKDIGAIGQTRGGGGGGLGGIGFPLWQHLNQPLGQGLPAQAMGGSGYFPGSDADMSSIVSASPSLQALLDAHNVAQAVASGLPYPLPNWSEAPPSEGREPQVPVGWLESGCNPHRTSVSPPMAY